MDQLIERSEVQAPELITLDKIPWLTREERILLESGEAKFYARDRRARVPILPESDARLEEILPFMDAPTARLHTGRLLRFVNGFAIADMFYNDHEARRQWREDIEKQHNFAGLPDEGRWKIFENLYENRNQFRVNKALNGGVVASIHGFGFAYGAYGRRDIKEELKERATELGRIIKGSTGKIYAEMTYSEKLTVVRIFVDATTKFLQEEFGNKVDYEEINVT